MSADNDDSDGQSGRWWNLFGLGLGKGPTEGTLEVESPEGDPHVYRDPTAREVWLPAKRRMLRKVADFLIDHDLEILPYTLGVAYDCVTGANPRLAQLILERSEKSQPITLRWLEDAVRQQGRDQSEEMLFSLMERLEDSLGEFSRTASGARSATSEYGHALQRHVDELVTRHKASAVIADLSALTRSMIDRTRAMENDLATSEQQVEALQHNLDEARRIADQDHLTGLPNRRAFDHLLDRQLEDARAAGDALCVAFIDIDHFKRINDTHGHAAGDRVLKIVAETLDRISDMRCHVARHGGEEFAVLFRGKSIDQAWKKLDAARSDIADRRLVNRATDRPFGQVTFSGGIADVFAHGDKATALKAADEALYAAKEAGRNLIVRATPRSPLQDAA